MYPAFYVRENTQFGHWEIVRRFNGRPDEVWVRKDTEESANEIAKGFNDDFVPSLADVYFVIESFKHALTDGRYTNDQDEIDSGWNAIEELISLIDEFCSRKHLAESGVDERANANE